jgi:beta-phosphoglucomutase
MIKACIFDLDGVIVDTARFHYIAWRRLANMLGFEFTEHDNERLKGVSRMDSLEILLSVGKITNLPDEKKLEYADMKNKWYVEYISTLTPTDILPGALEILGFLKSHDIKTAIGSASKNAMSILQGLKLEHAFDTIVDGTRIAKAKPDPQVFLTGAYDLKVAPNQCVVFEDAEAGVEAAIRGGMKCIGIGSPAQLGKADIVVPSLDKLNFEMVLSLDSISKQ